MNNYIPVLKPSVDNCTNIDNIGRDNYTPVPNLSIDKSTNVDNNSNEINTECEQMKIKEADTMWINFLSRTIVCVCSLCVSGDCSICTTGESFKSHTIEKHNINDNDKKVELLEVC